MLKRYFPILTWGRDYGRATFEADLVAALIVTIMLIPQALAYALLAGLPAQVGLYASIAPLLAYTLLGTSRTLAVGPVAIISLMTATAVGGLAARGTPEYLGVAVALAFLSGLIFVAMGLLRLGFIAAFLSHPVISGFISATGILIAAGQIKHFLGVGVEAKTLPPMALGLFEHLGGIKPVTVLVSTLVLGFLYWARNQLKPFLEARGLPPRLAGVLARAAPLVAVAGSTAATWALDLEQYGLAVVGHVPQGLPGLALPPLDFALWRELALPALLITIIGYVETISVAQTLAAKRRQRIDPDQELIAQGGINLASAFSGGMPISGGFARSVVNFDAGAATPAAGAFTALGMALATLLLTPALSHLPQTTLAATVFVALASLIDLRALGRVWHYSRSDGVAMFATIVVTLIEGVETGIATGVALSIGLHLWRSSRPHYAVIGQVPGTEHFRNVRRHRVVLAPDVLSIRIDESLWFANARFLEDMIYDAVAADPEVRHLVLNCPAINAIDASALEALEEVNARLTDAGVCLHLSEVKGPVMDRLLRSGLLGALGGQVFLTQFDAMSTLAPALTSETLAQPRCETVR
ncbi:SulP family inorganic anion transporter [Paenirhodobacter hankyongi]|uniref:Sulfate permease n=1 Tax=Paenirhodobacter hankyongi TaxID=2294033 RepID=A0A421BRP6_9RHOB|nr:sulfate permease [Sinirhodobacter hankyongi]RLL70964.1 sulfate permease [Sinirhodobacter hankyongi]